MGVVVERLVRGLYGVSGTRVADVSQLRLGTQQAAAPPPAGQPSAHHRRSFRITASDTWYDVPRPVRAREGGAGTHAEGWVGERNG